MATDQPIRRMTLRQLLTHSEKCSRDLIDQLNATLLPRVSDYRDLSRPVRRRSHYPKIGSLVNALNKLSDVGAETSALAAYLQEQLDEIRDRAHRERVNRL
jgi:hypothetical protein